MPAALTIVQCSMWLTSWHVNICSVTGVLIVILVPQVFQSISKDIMVRLASTQDQSPSGGPGSKSGAVKIGATPGGTVKKAACCSS